VINGIDSMPPIQTEDMKWAKLLSNHCDQNPRKFGGFVRARIFRPHGTASHYTGVGPNRNRQQCAVSNFERRGSEENRFYIQMLEMIFKENKT
jgi:hypothetical protein